MKAVLSANMSLHLSGKLKLTGIKQVCSHPTLYPYSLGGTGFTLLYFKMAVIPLVPETKMVDVGKLISLRNLLVRKVT